jgi:hypothetical protein
MPSGAVSPSPAGDGLKTYKKSSPTWDDPSVGLRLIGDTLASVDG